MKLYLLTQSTETDYDTYDSCVVAAMSPILARKIHPSGRDVGYSGTWPSDLSLVTVTFLGTAKAFTKTGVVLASFNAG